MQKNTCTWVYARAHTHKHTVTDACIRSVKGSFVKARTCGTPSKCFWGSHCYVGTLDRCSAWCRARQAGLMMLSQLLWISSLPGDYCRDKCLSWFEDTRLKGATQCSMRMSVCETEYVYSCRGKNERIKIDIVRETESTDGGTEMCNCVRLE